MNLLPADFDGFFSPPPNPPKIFDFISVHPIGQYLFTTEWLGASVDPNTSTAIDLKFRLRLDPTTPLSIGNKMTVNLDRNPNYSITNDAIKKQITIVSEPSNGGWLFWHLHCIGQDGVTEDYAWNGSSCNKCYEKKDFDLNPTVCGSYNMIRFFD